MKVMKTNKELTIDYKGNLITVPKGTKIKHINGAGGGYAVSDYKALITAGAWEHDVKHYYCYIKEEHIDNLPANATLLRSPLAKKSNEWTDTSFHWCVDLNGQKFDYYTGAGLIDNKGKPTHPTCDDVIHALVSDYEACETSFTEWCGNFGLDEDSRKAMDTYLACQKNGEKLRKAGIDIEKERERLQDY